MNGNMDMSAARPANRFLTGLSEEAYSAVMAEAATCTFSRGETLGTPGGPIERVFFLNSGLASVEAPIGAGRSMAVRLVGPDGAVGLEALLAPSYRAAGRVSILVPGEAIWLAAEAFRRIGRRFGEVRELCLIAAECQLLELGQTAACNARHSVQERCARWLLAIQSALRSDDLPVTHEFLAAALGVRRAGVTVTMRDCGRAGLIEQRRARIQIRDRAGLELLACTCHAEVRRRIAAVWSCGRATNEERCAAARPTLVAGGERAALKAAIGARETASGGHIEAVLGVCRDVLAQCRTALAAS